MPVMRGARWFVTLVVAASLLPASIAAEAASRHRIDVRERKDGTQELFDRSTGKRFVPRGAQLIVLGYDDGVLVDTLFGTQTYDPAFVEQAFADMESRGYNTVRVFLDLCLSDCIADPGGGLRDGYLANVADLLRIAGRHGLVVLLASSDLPDLGGYGETLPCCDPFGGYRNSAYLSGKGVRTLKRYWTEIVSGLKEANAPLQHVLAFELVQEWWVLGDVPPLSLDSGIVRTADGHTYDMAEGSDKRRMVEKNLQFLIRSVRAAILQLDPSALITVGFFPPPDQAAIEFGSPYVLYTEKAIKRSAMDFVDLHAYPGYLGNLDDMAEGWGVSKHTIKPMVMGEFGGFKFAYPSSLSAAEALAVWQADSCDFGFDGWVQWHWVGDEGMWGALEGPDEIADMLSPATRPKPCSPAGIPVNRSLDATATATASLPDRVPQFAIDGWIASSWVAGADAPQAIEIDLGAIVDVQRIELAITQSPAGSTVHRLYGRQTGADPWTLLREFSGSTDEGDWLVHDLGSPVAVRLLKVETTVSPAWVAWREIRVVGPP